MKIPRKLLEVSGKEARTKKQFMLLSKNKFILFFFVFLFGCAANYQNSSIEQIEKVQLPFVNSSPNYLIYEDFNKETPNCIIVLPFEIENKDRINIKNINIKEMPGTQPMRIFLHHNIETLNLVR